MRVAFQDNPGMIKMALHNRIHWPFDEKTVRAGFEMTHPRIEEIFDRVNTNVIALSETPSNKSMFKIS